MREWNESLFYGGEQEQCNCNERLPPGSCAAAPLTFPPSLPPSLSIDFSPLDSLAVRSDCTSSAATSPPATGAFSPSKGEVILFCRRRRTLPFLDSLLSFRDASNHVEIVRICFLRGAALTRSIHRCRLLSVQDQCV